VKFRLTFREYPKLRPKGAIWAKRSRALAVQRRAYRFFLILDDNWPPGQAVLAPQAGQINIIMAAK
ncbi:MAG: hypothetical protein JW866_09335, partial [Ignavibacteriales bacterium]|nr:hypothetical protein [Ignavibacteriales bacterium]